MLLKILLCFCLIMYFVFTILYTKYARSVADLVNSRLCIPSTIKENEYTLEILEDNIKTSLRKEFLYGLLKIVSLVCLFIVVILNVVV